jgi:hypothetical protein
MSFFLLTPKADGYGLTFAEEVLSVKLDGGASRYRRDILNSSIPLDCNWSLNLEQYNYMMAFYRSVAKKGAIPFQMQLVVDSGEFVERTVNFVPGSLKVTQSGGNYFVSASLEVHPLPEDEESDLDIIEAFEEAYD